MEGKLYKAVLDIQTDISSSILRGDTLFGLLCISILEHDGEARLEALLAGYTETNSTPFAIISDSLPNIDKGVSLPLATVANSIYHKIETHINGKKEEVETDRKDIKKLQYVTSDFLQYNYRDWLKHIYVNDKGQAEENETVFNLKNTSGSKSYTTIGNTIDRTSGTTLEGQLFQVKRNTFLRNQVIYIYLSEKEIAGKAFTQADLKKHLTAIGLTGYGANKNRGLGKFELVGDLEEWQWPTDKSKNASNSYITLSPCFLTSEDNIDKEKSFYAIETIFGKHGTDTSTKDNQYIKNPLTLISSHALIKPNDFNDTRLFIGHGLGRDEKISHAVSGTVHQGYSIVVPVYVSAKKEDGTK